MIVISDNESILSGTVVELVCDLSEAVHRFLEVVKEKADEESALKMVEIAGRMATISAEDRTEELAKAFAEELEKVALDYEKRRV